LYDFCMTMSEEPQFLYDLTETHTYKNTPPWATLAMASAAVHGSPPLVLVQCSCLPCLGRCCACSVYFCLPGGVSSVTFFTSARESNFFPNTGDICCRLCHHPSLSVSQRGTMCMPDILWAMLGTCNSLNSCCGCCFGWRNVHRWKKERVKTICGHRFLNWTTNNQKMEFLVGDYRGGCTMSVDGVRGDVLACLGWWYRRQKNKKYNTSWP
jgi:hypothetical protein